jgi:hypothetical protein
MSPIVSHAGRTIALCAIAAFLAGCSHLGGSAALPNGEPNGIISTHSQNEKPDATNGLPSGWACFPFGKPGGRPPKRGGPSARYGSDEVRPEIAYGCTVAGAKQEAKLQMLAVALLRQSGNTYKRYCTGTPIRFDPASRVGFVVTAAHCVLRAIKPAGASVTSADISAFRRNAATIYQGPIGELTGRAKITATVSAVYVPSRYCKESSMNGGCENLEKQNGDIAVLKIIAREGQTVDVLPNLQLAPKTLAIGYAQTVVGLGYGLNRSANPDDGTLYFVAYQSFGTDAYGGRHSEASIMNGYYSKQIKCGSFNCFYQIICLGDSGGGDFSWDGSHWNLVGAHSWVAAGIGCGLGSASYYDVASVSTDVRPFTAWIDRILRDDTARTGCASLGPEYVCRSRRDG